MSIAYNLLMSSPVANRNLEDIDAYYRTNPGLIVTKDKDAICTARPSKYIEQEEDQVRRRRGSAVGSVLEATDAEKHV